MRGAEWIAKARSAPLTARNKGSQSPDEERAVAEGIERLAKQLGETITQPVFGHSAQFPKNLAAEIGNGAFLSWVEKLLSTPRHVSNLIVPVLVQALRTRHPDAQKLWALAYPFQRGPFSHENFVIEGLDWTLVDIHDPALDDSLALEILKGLVLDCRSNTELVSVALGARLKSESRLTRVVGDLLEHPDPDTRARACYVVGWMSEDASLRQRLTKRHGSKWVERIAKTALQRLDREAHAREWLRRFLGEKRRAQRWAAGRLFLACRDAATPFWADNVIRKSTESSSRRAEAALLVRTIRNKVDDSELRDYFLSHSVRDLSGVVSPWYERPRWEDIEITSDD
jgi:hypothetical protein